MQTCAVVSRCGHERLGQAGPAGMWQPVCSWGGRCAVVQPGVLGAAQAATLH